ncbi:MAG: class I SAM-dependent methyltransferase [Pseudoxanthomonas sp.]|nr:class I SAM-dependent methyltransferase [Pseudoxanthomonas sp.]
MKASLHLRSPDDRPCPGCGGLHVESFADERIDESRINDFTYASRKNPEFMCLRLVRCLNCDLVFAPRPPRQSFLAQAYSDAAYDSGPEATAAAASYAQALSSRLAGVDRQGAAVDIGAGSGPLLPHLRRFGFGDVLGIEPSRAAIDAAAPAVRPLLLEGMFDPEVLRDRRISLLCSFMTLEHIDDPGRFARDAHALLQPGGMLAVVVHDWRAPLNRLLGLRSPIIDVEHLQLFSKHAIAAMLDSAGFERIAVSPIQNAYPLRYWVRLTPLPEGPKRALVRVLERIGLADRMIPLRVGNIMATAYKPAGRSP